MVRLDSVLSERWNQNRNRVILDCAGRDDINSAALRALIGFARRAHDQNGDLKLASVTPKIMSLVEGLGFHKIMEVADNVESEVETFRDEER